MVREEPREVRCVADLLLEVLRNRRVPLPSGGPRQRPVGDLTDQDVLERELTVALHPAHRLTADQVAGLERVQHRVGLLLVTDRRERPPPERLADHRRIEQDRALLGGKDVDARGDRLAHRARELRDAVRSLGHRCRQLLDEQRVPLCHLDQLADGRVGRVAERRRGVLSGQRLQRDRRMREQAGAPGRPCVEELGACEREERDGHVTHMGREVLHELELARVGPVDVLEHEHGRPIRREPFDQPSHGEEHRGLVLGLVALAEAEQERQVPPDLVDLALRHQRRQRLHQLRPGGRGRVALEDPGDALHVFGAGPVARLLLVGQGTAADGPGPVGLDRLEELLAQPGLPDAGWAEDRDQVGTALREHALPGAGKNLELAVTADEAGPGAGGGLLPDDEPRRDRLALPFRVDGREVLVADRPPRGAVGLLADDEPSRRGSALHPRGGVDHVAGGERLAAFVFGSEGDDRLAGADRAADAHARGRPDGVEGGDVLEHGDPAPDRALGVVAVRERRPEDGDGGVADELLDDTAEPLDLGAEGLEEQLQSFADVLGIALLGVRRRIHDVDEEHRDEFAFLRHRLSLRHRRFGLYRTFTASLLASRGWNARRSGSCPAARCSSTVSRSAASSMTGATGGSIR